MNDNENVVVEATENMEAVSTEEIIAEDKPSKTFTQDEVNDIVNKRLARKEARIRKEYERKYGDLESVLKAGTGKQSVEELTETFGDFYKGKGVNIPSKPTYSDRDIEVLARAEANDIINAGYDDVVEEVDRLAHLGANMTKREKALFKVLAEHRQSTERRSALSEMGVADEVYNSQEFQDFASKFNSKTSIKDIYDIYSKTKPKKEIQTMGSVKSTQTRTTKDFYTAEEIAKLTPDELRDPNVWETVRRSMTGK
jgi:hypothetical protein